ncbi:MAG: RNA-directed DNA polymerase [Microgenomates group bacterium]
MSTIFKSKTSEYIYATKVVHHLSHTQRETETERERERERRSPTIFTLPKLFTAYLSCRQTKRKTINALKFEIACEQKLLNLAKELKSQTYRPGRSICFIVTYPKLREIFAADFRDRIVHHLLINKIISLFEQRFIYDSFACREEKGTHVAVFRLRKFIYQVTKNKTQNAFYGQFDIKSFFSNIDKDVLFTIIEREINKSFPVTIQKEILWLTRTIIFHNPTQNYYRKGKKELFNQIPADKTLFKTPNGRGLPIGNLTSQFFANVYLNELDQFVKRKLKVKYYLRYVDDLVLLSESSEQLRRWRKEIDRFLKETLKLELHPNKDKYGSVYQGIDFVGYVVKPNYVLSRKRVVSNLKTKLHYFNQGLFLVSDNQRQKALPLSRQPTKEEIKQMTAMVNSYYGHFRWANSYRLRHNLYEKHFGELKKYLKPEKDLSFFSPGKPTG